MSCHGVRDRLDDFADGLLEVREAEAVQIHLASCDACSTTLGEIRDLVALAGSLPRQIDPPHDLWPEILTTIDSREGRVSVRRSLLAAAAVALITVSSGVTTLVLRESGDAVDAVPAAGIPGGLVAIETHFVSAVRELEVALWARRGSLSPQVMDVLERNLEILDAAIREARAALAGQPANRDLAEMLWSTYSVKLDLLQRATSL